MTVYRGCDALLVHGVSWTANRAAAAYFATGGRYGRPRDPVIVTGQIDKWSSDFYYCSEHGGDDTEAEIVCSPVILKVDECTGPWRDDSTYTTPWSAKNSIDSASSPESADS